MFFYYRDAERCPDWAFFKDKILDYIESNCSAGIFQMDNLGTRYITDFDEFQKLLSMNPSCLYSSHGALVSQGEEDEWFLYVTGVTEKGIEWLENHKFVYLQDLFDFLDNPRYAVPVPPLFPDASVYYEDDETLSAEEAV